MSFSIELVSFDMLTSKLGGGYAGGQSYGAPAGYGGFGGQGPSPCHHYNGFWIVTLRQAVALVATLVNKGVTREVVDTQGTSNNLEADTATKSGM